MHFCDDEFRLCEWTMGQFLCRIVRHLVTMVASLGAFPSLRFVVALKRAVFSSIWRPPNLPSDGRHVVVAYLELVYFVTALVPSDTACLASSPGSRSRTAVCISRLVIVDRRL